MTHRTRTTARARHDTRHNTDLKWWLVCAVGWYNREMIKAANAHGYTVALGDCYPFDVNIKNAAVIRYPCVCGGACVVRCTRW